MLYTRRSSHFFSSGKSTIHLLCFTFLSEEVADPSTYPSAKSLMLDSLASSACVDAVCLSTSSIIHYSSHRECCVVTGGPVTALVFSCIRKHVRWTATQRQVHFFYCVYASISCVGYSFITRLRNEHRYSPARTWVFHDPSILHAVLDMLPRAPLCSKFAGDLGVRRSVHENEIGVILQEVGTSPRHQLTQNDDCNVISLSLSLLYSLLGNTKGPYPM